MPRKKGIKKQKEVKIALHSALFHSNFTDLRQDYFP